MLAYLGLVVSFSCRKVLLHVASEWVGLRDETNAEWKLVCSSAVPAELKKKKNQRSLGLVLSESACGGVDTGQRVCPHWGQCRQTPPLRSWVGGTCAIFFLYGCRCLFVGERGVCQVQPKDFEYKVWWANWPVGGISKTVEPVSQSVPKFRLEISSVNTLLVNLYAFTANL